MIKAIKELIVHKEEYFFYLLFLAIAGISSAVLLNMFLEITEGFQRGELIHFDQKVTAYLHAYRTENLTTMVIAVTEMGSQWAYMIVIPIIAYLLYQKGHSWGRTWQATLILISTFLLNMGIKHLISRPRPLEESRLVEVADASFSYPSGHSMSAIAFYGFIIYLTFKYVDKNWLKYSLIFLQVMLILGIGLSRIYLGVHYPTDVAAGFIAGLIWLFICIVALRSVKFYHQQKEKRNIEPEKE